MDGAIVAPDVATRASARLVIDTNVLISALVFKDSRHVRLREAWRSGRVTPLLSVRTYRELKHVLGYPMFKLEDDQIAEGLALLGPFIEWVQLDPERTADLPKCSDRDDQKFVETAHCGRADALLTYDRALLKMRKKVAFDVVKPEVWMETAFG